MQAGQPSEPSRPQATVAPRPPQNEQPPLPPPWPWPLPQPGSAPPQIPHGPPLAIAAPWPCRDLIPQPGCWPVRLRRRVDGHLRRRHDLRARVARAAVRPKVFAAASAAAACDNTRRSSAMPRAATDPAATARTTAVLVPAPAVAAIAVAVVEQAVTGAAAADQRVQPAAYASERLVGVVDVILGIMAIGNRRRLVLPAGREVVGRHGSRNGVLEELPVRPSRAGQTQPRPEGGRNRECQSSPGSKTHSVSLNCFPWTLLEYPVFKRRMRPSLPARTVDTIAPSQLPPRRAAGSGPGGRSPISSRPEPCPKRAAIPDRAGSRRGGCGLGP